MGLRKKKKMIVKVVLCVVVIVLIVIALFLVFTKKDENDEMKVVEHTVVEGLYADSSANKCTEIVKITGDADVSSMDDKVILYLIFGMMKKDDILTDNISFDDYKEEALKVVGEDDIPLEFDYIFEGYKYTLDGDKITRSKTTIDENYVTKLYGYSGSDKLTVYVMAGYVKNDKVYDLNNQEIGFYSEDELNSILDKGTMQVYRYEKVNDDYKLVSVGAK